MMRKTHRAYAGAFWLGTTLAVDAIAVRTGHSVPVNPGIVVVGVFVAPLFSSGITSPDMDHQWAPGLPRNHYDWRYHRGFTHRVWFATMLTVLFGALPYLCAIRSGIPSAIGVLSFAPVNGWWSHLSGDMIFGRIKFGWWSHVYDPKSHRRVWRFWHTNIGLGWTTNGVAEKGGSLFRDPAAKISAVLSGVFALAHLALFVQTVS